MRTSVFVSVPRLRTYAALSFLMGLVSTHFSGFQRRRAFRGDPTPVISARDLFLLVMRGGGVVIFAVAVPGTTGRTA